MIELCGLNKSFDGIKAVDNISVEIKEGNVFGLIGTNGAGKSTVMRLMTGVLKPDSGRAVIDGENVYNNVSAKSRFFFIADDQYFFSTANARDMEKYYSSLYPDFDKGAFYEYLVRFGLDAGRKINTFSKGMKRQLILLLGICSNTKYLICDETFDGLDPVMRQSIKSIFASEIEKRQLTPIIASHNLRELEDICDHVGLLHKGGVLLSKDLEDMKCSIQKIQCVFSSDREREKAEKLLNIIGHDTRGSLHTYTVRETRESIVKAFTGIETIFFEILPLSLEEIFISETEVAGYDIKKLIFG
ncbi:ABC transporter ATP-binding protein [Lachnospiraceae bacterium NSJ-143]|nr:ABC transporter ATP-binding protein [Lachnospiraceae bacterium NSJ-143]